MQFQLTKNKKLILLTKRQIYNFFVDFSFLLFSQLNQLIIFDHLIAISFIEQYGNSDHLFQDNFLVSPKINCDNKNNFQTDYLYCFSKILQFCISEILQQFQVSKKQKKIEKKRNEREKIEKNEKLKLLFCCANLIFSTSSFLFHILFTQSLPYLAQVLHK